MEMQRIIDTMQETEFPSFDTNDYFEFTITPRAGYKIDFRNFTYKARHMMSKILSFRSSLDGFTSNIASPSMSISAAEQTPVPIRQSDFQNCVSGIVLDFMVGKFSANGTSVLMNLHLWAVICTTLAPTIKNVQPNCIANGSIELNNLPADSKWDLYQNDV
jgi:hypothetical protein